VFRGTQQSRQKNLPPARPGLRHGALSAARRRRRHPARPRCRQAPHVRRSKRGPAAGDGDRAAHARSRRALRGVGLHGRVVVMKADAGIRCTHRPRTPTSSWAAGQPTRRRIASSGPARVADPEGLTPFPVPGDEPPPIGVLALLGRPSTGGRRGVRTLSGRLHTPGPAVGRIDPVRGLDAVTEPCSHTDGFSTLYGPPGPMVARVRPAGPARRRARPGHPQGGRGRGRRVHRGIPRTGDIRPALTAECRRPGCGIHGRSTLQGDGLSDGRPPEGVRPRRNDGTRESSRGDHRASPRTDVQGCRSTLPGTGSSPRFPGMARRDFLYVVIARG
jgi:hypothetical protein